MAEAAAKSSWLSRKPMPRRHGARNGRQRRPTRSRSFSSGSYDQKRMIIQPARDCCSRMSVYLAQVSEQSTPPPKTPVQMPCSHLPANVRFRSPLFLHALTVPLRLSFPGPYRCEATVRRNRQMARASASGATTITTASRATQEVGETRRTRRRTGPRSERA